MDQLDQACLLAQNVRDMQIDDSFVCPGCRTSISRLADVKRHLRENRCPRSPCLFTCTQCQHKVYASRAPCQSSGPQHNFGTHEQLPNPVFGCSCCGRFLNGYDELINHIFSQGSSEHEKMFRPGPLEHCSRLCGLLQQPRIQTLFEQSMWPQVVSIIRSLRWDLDWCVQNAKGLADKLEFGTHSQYGVTDALLGPDFAMLEYVWKILEAAGRQSALYSAVRNDLREQWISMHSSDPQLSADTVTGDSLILQQHNDQLFSSALRPDHTDSHQGIGILMPLVRLHSRADQLRFADDIVNQDQDSESVPVLIPALVPFLDYFRGNSDHADRSTTTSETMWNG